MANQHLLLVLSNPVDGREREYNDWYDNTHLPEVLSVDGFTAAQRFAVNGEAAAGTSQYRYVALYELDTPTPEVSMAALSLAITRGEVHMSDAIDSNTVMATLIRPITGRLTRT